MLFGLLYIDLFFWFLIKNDYTKIWCFSTFKYVKYKAFKEKVKISRFVALIRFNSNEFCLHSGWFQFMSNWSPFDSSWCPLKFCNKFGLAQYTRNLEHYTVTWPPAIIVFALFGFHNNIPCNHVNTFHIPWSLCVNSFFGIPLLFLLITYVNSFCFWLTSF